jgi:CMP-N-acetylneuraminic acid synthetase
VSSDDEEILTLAAKLGVEPLKRSADASRDTSSANSVILDLENQEDFFESLVADTIIVYLQPTSPMRTRSQVSEALSLYCKENQPVVAVTNVSEFPQKMLILDESKHLTRFLKEGNSTANRQELPTLLIPNGAIYIFKFSEFKKLNQFPIEGAVPYFMPRENSIDIDSPIDLTIASTIFDQIQP